MRSTGASNIYSDYGHVIFTPCCDVQRYLPSCYHSARLWVLTGRYRAPSLSRRTGALSTMPSPPAGTGHGYAEVGGSPTSLKLGDLTQVEQREASSTSQPTSCDAPHRVLSVPRGPTGEGQVGSGERKTMQDSHKTQLSCVQVLGNLREYRGYLAGKWAANWPFSRQPTADFCLPFFNSP